MSGQGPQRYPRTLRLPGRTEIEIEERPRPPRRVPVSSLPLLLFAGFTVVILVGTLLLMLPVSSESGEWTSFYVALFVSTSSVCVTGLVPVDTATYWSGFGEAVVLLLMQLGGLGFMTSATLLFLLFGWRLGLRERIYLSQSMDLSRLGGVVALARRAIMFTLVVELAGFIVLFLWFATEEPVGRAAWWGLFHSVSAFNNAGFDLMGDFRSLRDHADVVTLGTVGLLALIGSLGFLVVEDMRAVNRNTRWLTADSAIVLRTSASLIVVGFLVFLLLEWGNALEGMSAGDKLLQGMFHALSHRTAGFASAPIGDLHDETQFFVLALMFIGGASGSTAGGIKVATFAVIMATAVAAIKGRDHTELAGREIPRSDVDRALAVTILAGLMVFVVAFALARLEDFDFLPVLFEATSAFSTNGLSTGITPTLDDKALVLLSLTMLIGRLGPMTLVLALVQRAGHEHRRLPEERVRIG